MSTNDHRVIKFTHMDEFYRPHCEDGPAVLYFDSKEREWWFHGKRIPCNSQEEFLRYLKLKSFM